MRTLSFTILLLFITAIGVAQKSALIITNIETGNERRYTYGKHTKLITDSGIKYSGNLKVIKDTQSVVVLKKDTIPLNNIAVFKIRNDAVALIGNLLSFTGVIISAIGVGVFISNTSNNGNANYISSGAILGVGLGLTGTGIGILAIHKKYDSKKYSWKIE